MKGIVMDLRYAGRTHRDFHPDNRIYGNPTKGRFAS